MIESWKLQTHHEENKFRKYHNYASLQNTTLQRSLLYVGWLYTLHAAVLLNITLCLQVVYSYVCVF